MKPHDDTPPEAARAIAEWLRHLPPGPLAELRRMTEEAPAPVFWRLAARYPGTIGRQGKQREWSAIVRILAILADKGEPASRSPLHDSSRALGEVLCDGGDPNWSRTTGPSPRPVFSERRLAQLMSARGIQRSVCLERAARAVAAHRVSGSGVNVVDIAYAVLRPHDTRRLAEAYYRRLDRAEQDAQQSEKGTEP